ncbi:unnamed protein product [Acanthoscelides obtectus]|uniref:Uncharacterized protein n=2 Tax=Acanthoscelides obtectus TaxID=200917 RepID=A0A9P0PT72_ACAOB|nr:unnamed protein product [Acanthoscelides obtectus]CAK1620839.1 hypothetical protein AOBTE_LOCUS606 [Acanthoscelides obtectus]
MEGLGASTSTKDFLTELVKALK